MQPLLFEIGLEELPTREVLQLSEQLKTLMTEELTQAKISFKNIKSFGSPRRLAILIEALAPQQADYRIEKKGPASKMAFDENGNPSKALEGFARANQIDVSQLQKKDINGGEFMVYLQQVTGKPTKTLIPELLTAALKKLRIAKPMRWGDSDLEFVRPIHWLCLIYGTEAIETTIFDVKTENKTYGHRFHAPAAITVTQADGYEDLLRKNYVIVDFEERKESIKNKIRQLEKDHDLKAVMLEELLNEVTALVEWPMALLVDFDPAFLAVPEEGLISAMQTHQKAFYVTTKEGKLLPKFITIANIYSKDSARVIQGNARVMRARLADAKFFFTLDFKTRLESRLEKLKSIIFQQQLGSVYQRAERIAALANYLAGILQLDSAKAETAGLLAKADLVSAMVQEFPELQGTMGYYYALNDSLDADIAIAIRDHYLPKFAEDNLPNSDYGCIISLADRMDKLVGIFGINQLPTGVKDPFALRRAAIGLLSIIINKEYHIDLTAFIHQSIALYQDTLINPNTATAVFEFIMERLKHWYQAKNIKVEFFNAVSEKQLSDLTDFNLRIHAVKNFSELPEAESLAAANKRVSNILAKESITTDHKINDNLLQENAEKKLAAAIKEKSLALAPLVYARQYTEILQALADLREPIDTFFDEVMVMVEDIALKNNRLALLSALRNLFLETADISKLSK